MHLKDISDIVNNSISDNKNAFLLMILNLTRTEEWISLNVLVTKLKCAKNYEMNPKSREKIFAMDHPKTKVHIFARHVQKVWPKH